MTTARYFVYLRKSSEAEERQELSIPAQLRELTDYADRHKLTLVGQPLEESQSAKTPGRPIFGDMMKAIEKRKADGILCWKPDRLARNPLDSGRIMQALADNVLQEVRTPDYSYNRSGADKLLLALQFGMATKYSDDLSDNVKRGNREALLRGFWPNRPPMGYLRDHDTYRIIADPDRFPLIQELWRMLLSGVPAVQLLRYANERGFRTPTHKSQGGIPLGRSRLYQLLQDPFYAGLMEYGGELYQGAHPPMVTIAEFDQARAILKGRQCWAAPSEKPFYVYRGLVTCGACHGQVTVKTTINRSGFRYVHYYCWKKNTAHLYCPEGAVQESTIDQAVLYFLDELVLPPNWMQAIYKKLDSLKARADEAIEESRRKNAELLRRISDRLERLRVLLVDGTISTEEYARDRTKLVEEQFRLQELVASPAGSADYLEPWKKGLDVLNEAKKILTSDELSKKRELIKSLTLNLVLKEKTVLIEAKKPFSIFREWRRCPSLFTFWDFLRTHILND